MTSIIELYEYQIHHYDPTNFHSKFSDYKHLFKFGDIDDSPDTDCRRITIEGSQNSVEKDTSRSSCDPIYNINGGKLKPKELYDLDNIYGNYKLFLANNNDIQNLDESSVDKLLQNITDTIDTQINLLNSDKSGLDYLSTEIIDKKDDIFRNIDVTNKSRVQEFANQTAIIQNLNVTNINKIILFGDLHGSFHTFFRSLCRLHRYGILNLETFEITHPYKIIFLGDILDRGLYALDILNIIFKFITINNKDPQNPKIIYNRGNHENYDQYLYKFENGMSDPVAGIEIYYKFVGDKQTDVNLKNKFDEFIMKFNYLLCILPSAVIINNRDNNEKIWCCHGGFPESYIERKKIDFTNTFILLDDINESKDIRWSDFGQSVNGDNFSPSQRGLGLKTYTHKGLTKFLKNNNINFLIRGHQDSYDNSVLFGLFGNQILINNPKNKDIPKILIYNKNEKIKNRFSGSIARLILDLKLYTQICPVLTISTNTDSGRYLNSDSFALLHFNFDLTNIDDFDKNTLTILKSIKSSLKNENINKDNIIIRNLETCNKIFEIYNNIIYILFDKIINNTNFTTIYQSKFDSNPGLFDKIMYLQNIYYDIYDIVIYYYGKITNLRQKVELLVKHDDILFNDNQKIALNNIIQEMDTIYNKILSNIQKFQYNSDLITESDIVSNIDNYVEYNDIDEMIENINILVKEYETYNA